MMVMNNVCSVIVYVKLCLIPYVLQTGGGVKTFFQLSLLLCVLGCVCFFFFFFFFFLLYLNSNSLFRSDRELRYTHRVVLMF